MTLPDVTTTDPWRAPPAARWQPATTAPDPHRDDLQRGPERTASAADVVPERGSQTTPERPGPATDATGGDPEITGIRTALERLVDGQITDDDLARIGLTPEQAARLFDADIDHAADQHRAEPAAGSATPHLLPDRDYVDPVYASLTEEDHEANRRAASDAWTNTVRREGAQRDRAASDPGPSPAAQDSAGAQRWFDDEWAPAVADRASRQVIPDHPAADPLDRLQDRIDRLHDRLNDIQQTFHNPARERAPTGGASTHRGRHVSPDIGDGLDPPYGYPADTPSTDLADPRYQQSEIDPGPNMEI